MNSGDLCTIDSDGFLTVCGRSKTMILGPSGQNIYPEEIEQKLNNLPYVLESLVIEDHGKLIGLVVPDYELMSSEGVDLAKLPAIMEENLKTLNESVPAYSRLKTLEMRSEEFEKTPKRSIRRYLYQRK